MSDDISLLSQTLRASLNAIKPLPDPLVFDATSQPDPLAMANVLATYGIVVARNFVTREAAAFSRASLEPQLDKCLAAVRAEQTQEHERYVVNFQLERFKTFPELVNHPKPIFNLRNGKSSMAPDSGFIDLFKPDVLFPDCLAAFHTLLAEGLPKQVAAKFQGIRYADSSFNLYINDGIAQTRDFHIDAEVHHIKAFLYLTDVLTLDDGPYCYVPGSHNETQIKSINKLYNKGVNRPWTDMFLVDPANAIACMAPAGTLILSLQSGIHRGYPQKPDKRRLMLVQLFEPS